MGRLIDTDALTTALIDAYGLDPERLRDVVERIPAAECDDAISRQADIHPCDTCEYSSLDWHEEPCESCTGEDNHWKPSATQTNASNALETLDCISRAAALDAIGEQPLVWTEDDDFAQGKATQWEYDIDAIKALPSAQPYALDEWCTDCKEYDAERHCCPRYNRVIRDALKMREGGEDEQNHESHL